MKAIKILSYVFYSALIVLLICIVLNYKFKYFAPVMGIVLITSSVLFFLEAYSYRKSRINQGFTHNI